MNNKRDLTLFIEQAAILCIFIGAIQQVGTSLENKEEVGKESNKK